MSIYNVMGSEVTDAFDLAANGLYSAYNIGAGRVYHKYAITLVHSVLESLLNVASGKSPQGMAIYGDYIVQFFSDNKFRVFSLHDFTLLATISCDAVSHGNTMHFGVTEQDTGFPLLYVSEWGESGEQDSKMVDVVKISTTGYEKISSYTFPTSCGNHPSQIVDWATDTVWIVGYSGGTRDSEYMIISRATISTPTTILEQFQVPYMGVLNGWEYYDGKLIYYGNAWDGTTLVVSFIDTLTHSVSSIEFPKQYNSEYEDCCVVDNTLYMSSWIMDANDGNKLKYRIYSMEL